MKYLLIKPPTYNGAHRNLWYEAGEVAFGRPARPGDAKYMNRPIESYVAVDPPEGSQAFPTVVDAECVIALDTPDLNNRTAVEEWLDAD